MRGSRYGKSCWSIIRHMSGSTVPIVMICELKLTLCGIRHRQIENLRLLQIQQPKTSQAPNRYTLVTHDGTVRKWLSGQGQIFSIKSKGQRRSKTICVKRMRKRLEANYFQPLICVIFPQVLKQEQRNLHPDRKHQSHADYQHILNSQR